MTNEVTLSGVGCCITLKGASSGDINEVKKALMPLSTKCVGLQEREICAHLHSELEVISGDGHNFGWELDFNADID